MSTYINAIRRLKASTITLMVSDHWLKQNMDVINLSLA